MSLYISKLFGLSIKAGKIKKRLIWCKYVYIGTWPINFYCIFLQVFDTSPKLNVSHTTETNSSYRSGIWFKGPCLIFLSVTQNNCWLAAESNFEKENGIWLKSIALIQSFKMKSKKIIVALKSKKMLLFEKIDKNFQCNSVSRKFLKLLFVSA